MQQVRTCRVRQAADGTWFCRPYLGRGADGRPLRPQRSFPAARSEAEAQAMADEWCRALGADGLVHSARLADLLADYAATAEANGASPNTLRQWRLFARYAERGLGASALASELTVADLNRFLRRLMAPKEAGGQGLSRNSALACYQYLRGAFNHFVAVGACDRNPLVMAAKPRPERREAQAVAEWDYPALSRALADAMGGDDLRLAACAFAAWLALATGVRRGEACALRRRDVMRAARSLHVSGNVVEEPGKPPYRRELTKGKRSRNVAVTEDGMARIAAWCDRLDAELGRLPPDAPLVTADGSLMRPSAAAAGFRRIRRAAGLPEGVTFHSLRHTHASWLVAQGCDLKTLSERMGHASEATTLRIYAHLMPGRDRAAAELFEQAARAAGGGL